MTKIPAIFFDMDGTIADLYSVPDWLPKLRSFDPSPYLEAAPMVNMEELSILLVECQEMGITVGVISWASKDNCLEYRAQVRKCKRQWLAQNLPITFDKIHITKYGTPKHTVPVPPLRRGILIDDNDEVLTAWRRYGGIGIDAKDKLWMETLRALVE